MATLTKRATDRTSKTGSSPGAYRIDGTGDWVIQGWFLTPTQDAELTNIDRATETAVRIPENVAKQIAARCLMAMWEEDAVPAHMPMADIVDYLSAQPLKGTQ